MAFVEVATTVCILGVDHLNSFCVASAQWRLRIRHDCDVYCSFSLCDVQAILGRLIHQQCWSVVVVCQHLCSFVARSSSIVGIRDVTGDACRTLVSSTSRLCNVQYVSD